MKDLKIFSALKKYVSVRPTRFHMPGHKGGAIAGLNCKYDITELPTVENEKIVSSAEKDCAKILGADFLRFLSDGASAGIFSAICAAKNVSNVKNPKIIINRTAHKSIYNALKIFGIEPVLIAENVTDGLFELPTAKEVLSAINDQPNVIGAVLTYPDYYGRVFDIKAVSEVLVSAGKILIIDNAHGNHYAFCQGLTYAGKYADIWVDGVHKTNYTLNQGAIICCRKRFAEEINSAVGEFSTTSPSYPILASVEYGIKYSHKNGAKDFLRLKVATEKLKSEIRTVGFSVVENTDVLKLAVDIAGAGFDIEEAQKAFEKNKIFAEMYDGRYVLFMFSVATKNSQLNKIVKTLKKLTVKKQFIPTAYARGVRKTDYLFATRGEYELTDLKNAVGKTAAENFGTFPPCYPICVAGETITSAAVDSLKAGNTFGITDGKVKTLTEKGQNL